MIVTRFLHLSNQNLYTAYPDVTETTKPQLEERKKSRHDGFSCMESKASPLSQVSFVRTACKQQSEPLISSFRNKT